MEDDGRELADRAPVDRTGPDCGPLPPFSVRESNRARHVRLVMSVRAGLEVVVPRGFDRRGIPAILKKKARWIERATARAEVLRPGALEGATALPTTVELPCLGAEWRIEYVPPVAVASGRRGEGRPLAAGGVRVTVREKPGRVLLVGGCGADPAGDAAAAACRAALRRWLSRKARKTIVPRLVVLATQRGFTIGPVSVRAQRTRWASCTRRGGISLNMKLLFLPPDLTDHVLLHELCHTVRMDHSSAFWALMKEHDSECRLKQRRLKQAQSYVPSWFNQTE